MVIKGLEVLVNKSIDETGREFHSTALGASTKMEKWKNYQCSVELILLSPTSIEKIILRG